MKQPTHIVLCGEVDAGKSTLVQRLLQVNKRPVYGFITKRLAPDATGFHPIYIHPAGEDERIWEEKNMIGTCDTKTHNINQEVFNTLGVSYLSAKEGGLIVMDELGFMEAKAERFVKAVFAALDGDIPVLATVKARYDVPFCNDIRGHKNVHVYNVTPENREVLYQELLPIMEEWNQGMEEIR